MLFILVLGADIKRSNSSSNKFIPGPILQSRLDMVHQLFRNPSEQKIIVSGTRIQVSAMVDHLLSKGIATTNIIKESYSNNVIESINNVIQILHIRGALYSKNNELVVVTSDYHMPRTKLVVNHYLNDLHLNVTFKETNTPVDSLTLMDFLDKESKCIDQLEVAIADLEEF